MLFSLITYECYHHVVCCCVKVEWHVHWCLIRSQRGTAGEPVNFKEINESLSSQNLLVMAHLLIDKWLCKTFPNVQNRSSHWLTTMEDISVLYAPHECTPLAWGVNRKNAIDDVTMTIPPPVDSSDGDIQVSPWLHGELSKIHGIIGHLRQRKWLSRKGASFQRRYIYCWLPRIRDFTHT